MKKKLSILSILAILLIGVLVLSEFVIATVTSINATMDNHPPNAPSIKGPINMRPGTHEWTFVSTDPDGDNVSYQICWGDSYDELTGWYASGEKITVSHCFSGIGRVSLLARAIDIHNATGEWGSLSITISNNDQMTNSLIIQFFSQFMKNFLR